MSDYPLPHEVQKELQTLAEEWSRDYLLEMLNFFNLNKQGTPPLGDPATILELAIVYATKNYRKLVQDLQQPRGKGWGRNNGGGEENACSTLNLQPQGKDYREDEGAVHSPFFPQPYNGDNGSSNDGEMAGHTPFIPQPHNGDWGRNNDGGEEEEQGAVIPQFGTHADEECDEHMAPKTHNIRDPRLETVGRYLAHIFRYDLEFKREYEKSDLKPYSYYIEIRPGKKLEVLMYPFEYLLYYLHNIRRAKMSKAEIETVVRTNDRYITWNADDGTLWVGAFEKGDFHRVRR